MMPPILAVLMLAAAHGQCDRPVPRDPPFIFLWHSAGQSADSPRHVVAALWPDGRWLRAGDPDRPDRLYRTGRLDSDALVKVVCELESIDLWGYAESNTPMLGPFEGLSMRQGKELKRWICPRELVFSDCGFPDFEEAKKALLGAASAKNSSVTWEGIADLSWSTAAGKSTAPPRCPRLVDPAAILSQIRPGNEKTIVSSLWERHGRWSAVLDGVSGAQDVWLDVAERLRPGTDAGSAEEIDMAIGEAFMRAPEKVLRRFGPRDVCHTLGFAYQSDLDQKEVFALLKRRRALAEAIDASDLAVARAACLAELDKLQAELDDIHR